MKDLTDNLIKKNKNNLLDELLSISPDILLRIGHKNVELSWTEEDGYSVEIDNIASLYPRTIDDLFSILKSIIHPEEE